MYRVVQSDYPISTYMEIKAEGRSSVVLEYVHGGRYEVVICLCIWTSRRAQLFPENLAGILLIG